MIPWRAVLWVRCAPYRMVVMLYLQRRNERLLTARY